ncbi:MAG: hypothetical protein SGPRY_012817, partial [Prymnesium sp.]
MAGRQLLASSSFSLWGAHLPPHDHPSSARIARQLGVDPGSWARGCAQRPRLTTYLVKARSARPMVIVLPGGGYMFLSIAREGVDVCSWLNAADIHCAILEYRVLRAHPGPLLDARRAIQFVRNQSTTWAVDPNCILTLGFSAGGHLSGHVALSWNAAVGRRVDEKLQLMGDQLSTISARPDAAILAYPVVSARNDSIGVVGVAPHTCATYLCVGRARRGEGRPVRHHGSIELLLGARLGNDLAEAS